MNLIGQTLHQSLRTKNLNILLIPTHETANSALANAFPDYKFYFLYRRGLKKWDNRFRALPPNCYLLKDGQIPIEMNFDLIISQNAHDQYAILAPIADQYKIPLICITHTQPYPSMSKRYLSQVKNMRGDFDVFITKSSMNAWGWDDNEGIVIEHSIDTEEFKPDESIEREPYILSVCNQFNKPVRFQPCGYPLWCEVIHENNQSLPYGHLGADCGDFAQPAKNLDDLIQNYQKALIFINTSQISPIPMSLLEAAACAACPITTATCDIPNIFTHGHDCLMSNNPKELRGYCVEMLNNPQEAMKLGQNARETIKKRFKPERFQQDWVKVFNKALKGTHAS